MAVEFDELEAGLTQLVGAVGDVAGDGGSAHEVVHAAVRFAVA
ncbi:hypothetical protein [Dactylosporangium sp. NPDC050588]